MTPTDRSILNFARSCVITVRAFSIVSPAIDYWPVTPLDATRVDETIILTGSISKVMAFGQCHFVHGNSSSHVFCRERVAKRVKNNWRSFSKSLAVNFTSMAHGESCKTSDENR